jgi:peptidoglycan/LPS O-acetylase OafA/YrhL
MAFNRKVDLICGALETGLLLVLLPQWLIAKSYIASTILTFVLGGIAFCHFKGRRWAARASLYIVFIGTAFTIFGLFPPFDENDRPTLPLELKVAILIGLVAGSTALLVMLYLRLRPEGQRPRWLPNEPLIEFLRNTFVNSHAKSQDRRDET